MIKIKPVFFFFCIAICKPAFSQEILDRPPGLPDSRTTIPIVFRHHTGQSIIERTIIRGEYACYTFFSRKGQRLDTFLNDGPDQNVYLSVFEPGFRAKKNELTGVYGLSGHALPNLGEDTDQKEAHTFLSKSGKYVMCLTTGRGGGGHFKMIVHIK